MPVTGTVLFNSPTFSRISVAILRETLVFARTINRDFEPEFAQPGDTVNTRKPVKFNASDFDSATGAVISNISAPSNIAIVLNNHKHVAFNYTDMDQSKSPLNLRETFIDPAMLALANSIDRAIAALYATITNFTTASSAGSLKTAIQTAQTRLNKNLVPAGDRYAVLSDDDYGNLAGVAQLEKANETPGQTLTDGVVPRLKGFNVIRSSNIIAVGSPAVRHNMCFHKNAFTLAVRPLAADPMLQGNQAVTQNTMIEADSGNALRVTTAYEPTFLRKVCIIDTVFGVKELDTALGINIRV